MLYQELLRAVFLLEQQKNKLNNRRKLKNFLAYAQHVYEVSSLGDIIKSLQKNWSQSHKESSRLIVNMPDTRSQRRHLISALVVLGMIQS